MSLYGKLPKKPTKLQQFLRKLNLRQRLIKITRWIIGLLIVFSCAGLTYLAASGAWHALVSTVTSLISQGPAAIASAIIAGLFSWYCVLPLLGIVLFVLLAVFVPSWLRKY